MNEAMGPTSGPEGWYPAGDGSVERYWDGSAWTNATRPAALPGAASNASGAAGTSVRIDKRAVAWAVLAIGVIGGALACFTQVSLLSGTGTVWVGVVIAVLALVASVALRLGRVFVIVLAIVAALALGAAVYDEVQLSHRRHELSNLFDN